METWRKVWREGIAPQLSVASLEALRSALLSDDKCLIQGATSSPPSYQCTRVWDWPVEAACLVGFAGWRGERMETVSEVIEYFSTVCFECDRLMGEPAACRFFLNFFDETPRDEVRRNMLFEVNRALAERTTTQDNSDVQPDYIVGPKREQTGVSLAGDIPDVLCPVYDDSK